MQSTMYPLVLLLATATALELPNAGRPINKITARTASVKNVAVGTSADGTVVPAAIAPPSKPGKVESTDETLDLCRNLFTRFSRGQELLRRNHGVPVLNQQAVLDLFITYLNVQCRVPAEVTEMLQRMRAGSLMNNAGGTSGGRLQMTRACMNREPAFFDSLCESFFKTGPTSHFELFPSTTKSIEAFLSMLAVESEVRERPIKVLLPSDCHYCWGNIGGKYASHPYLQLHHLDVGGDGIQDVRLRRGDFVISVFTFANTVSGRTTNLEWFEELMSYCKGQGAEAYAFVDSALAGCKIARDVLDLRADAPPQKVRTILESSIGLVQSGFKDYGLSSLLFIDDAPFECCSAHRADDSGLQSVVAGASHPLIKHAPVTSIPESPTMAFLIFAKEYTAFRKQTFNELVNRLHLAIPPNVGYTIRPLFPLLHVEFDEKEIASSLTSHLMETYSLITIDAEPNVLRLWPTPTNHDIGDAIEEWFEEEASLESAVLSTFDRDDDDEFDI